MFSSSHEIGIFGIHSFKNGFADLELRRWTLFPITASWGMAWKLIGCKKFCAGVAMLKIP